MSRRGRAVVAVALVVLVAAVGAVTLIQPWRTSGAASSAAPTRSTPSTAGAVAAALDQLASHPERLVPDALKDTVRPADAVPSGTKVHPRTATWVGSGSTSGTMQIDVISPGGVTTRYIAVMLREGGTWRVLETEPVG